MSPESDAPWPGQPFPLGATPDGAGTNFSVWSRGHAVELCLFDPAGAETRVALQEETHHIWHGYLPGVVLGQRYGYRVAGPYAPARGQLFNPHKLLLDPYTRAVDGTLTLHEALFQPADAPRDDRDSAAYVPRSVVVDDDFDWGGDRPPRVPWADTVIYEMNVRGFTAGHPEVPETLRGTYAGLAHPAAIEHLTGLGVTAVELLPVHQFVSEPALTRRGLANYWGYNTLGYFAPHAGYAAAGSGGGQVREFKEMVAALHAAGLEVILDVVFNHTAEGRPDNGPTLSWRGLDNGGYYRLRGDDPARYTDYSGCGNTLDLRQPQVRRMVTDSLRYWVADMHVDGFRFDLTCALTRSTDEVDFGSAFLAVIDADPVLSPVKLIAEPWDLGPGGYQAGRFPPPWAEWNDRYRDAIRGFWSGASTGVRELGSRLAGSSDVYAGAGRRPYASVNYVTAHDGFTLHDLVTYQQKRNTGNGEDNRDGTDDNRSWNCGTEGETADPAVNALRGKQVRNLLITLLLSVGVPMLTAGDELRRTQHGNNNAYCHDDELVWLDWKLDDEARALLAFVKRLLALRAASPVFRPGAFLSGRAVDGVKDLAWFGADGAEMIDADWNSPTARALGMYLDGRSIPGRGGRGERIVDHSYLVLFHAGDSGIDFCLPAAPWATGYDLVLDTSDDDAEGGCQPGRAIALQPRSVVVLRALRRA